MELRVDDLNKPLITTSNIKLGGSIAQVNMPYVISCREDAPCKKQCYAAKGPISWKTAKNSHIVKYNIYKNRPDMFFYKLHCELTFVSYRYFRWHSVGDIVDEQYLDNMCKLAVQHPDTNFLCFTKKFELVNDYLDTHDKPDNLSLVLSNWKNWTIENRHNLPESFVDFGDNKEELKDDSFECSGKCSECQHCWHMSKGDSVVFHKH